MTLPGPLVISWIGFHGRSQSLAKAIGGDAVFHKTEGSVIRRYIRQHRETRETCRDRPDVPIVVMLPPLPALLSTLRSRRYQGTVWADLHTGVFEDPRWRWARRYTLRLVRRHCAGALVTNESLASRARQAGIKDVVVLDDIIEPRPRIGRTRSVVFPVTYANDEPIAAILAAASLVPEVRWVLTGKAPQAVRANAPANVVFPGFLGREDFVALMCNASAIGALTNRPFTMQRAGYEALELGAPLITSPTNDLRSYFGDAAVYSDSKNSPESIAAGVRRLIANNDHFAAAMTDLRTEKLVEQEQRIARFKRLLKGDTSVGGQ